MPAKIKWTAVEMHGVKAFMGYKATRDGICVRVCSYCPDTQRAERTAEVLGLPVTHGICPTCYARTLAALKLD